MTNANGIDILPSSGHTNRIIGVVSKRRNDKINWCVYFSLLFERSVVFTNSNNIKLSRNMVSTEKNEVSNLHKVLCENIESKYPLTIIFHDFGNDKTFSSHTELEKILSASKFSINFVFICHHIRLMPKNCNLTKLLIPISEISQKEFKLICCRYYESGKSIDI
jgi:hypothetical protein